MTLKAATVKKTRGERLNNPGLIEHGDKWQGLAPDQPDKRFAKFSDPVYGMRAIGKIILTYYRRRGLKTIRDMVERWAPPGENDSESYVAHVAQIVAAEPDAQIDPTRPEVMAKLIRAIVTHENGRNRYSDQQITSAVVLALS